MKSKKLVRLLKLITPPIFLKESSERKPSQPDKAPVILTAAESGEDLFGGRANFFANALEKCRVYGEYGCGKSTVWVANFTTAETLSVDTDAQWISNVQNACQDQDRLTMHLVDVGRILQWGIPSDPVVPVEKLEEYTDWIWLQNRKPDVVLIDGRFRVACFLTSLKYMEAGGTIVFDDYIQRPQYHFVEKFLPPAKKNENQALFIIPQHADWTSDDLDYAIEAFRYNAV